MSFKSRLIPVFLFSLLFFMAGCEERAEQETPKASFKLVTPVANSSIYDIKEKKIKVKHFGPVSNANIILYLNGTDVTDKFIPNDNFSDTVVATMVNTRNALVQGDNTLLVGQMLFDANDLPVPDVNGRPTLVASKTFHFYLDSIPPRITINSVVPSVANGDGSPASGSAITVEGDLVDVSAITSLQFTSPGGTVVLAATTNDPVGNNQFNNTTKTYRAVLTNYPSTAVATDTPHFTYTITDVPEQTRTERFMASGTPVARQKALQINDSLALNFNPLINGAISNAFTLVNSGANFFGVGSPLYDDPLDAFNSTNPNSAGFPREPAIGERMKNPRNNCVFPSPDIANVEECRPSAYTGGVRVFIFPANSAQCSGLLFRADAGVTDCVVFVRNLEIDTPAIDFEFDEKSNQLLLNLSLWFKDVNADVEIAGVRNENDGIFPLIPDNYTYLGGLKGRITLSKFTVETDLRLYPDSNFKIGVQRVSPFRLVLTDLLKVPTVTGTCNICSPVISAWAMIALALGTDINDNNIKDKKELVNMISQTVETKAGPLLDNAISTFMTGSPATVTKMNTPINNKQIISNSSVVDAYAVYNNNAHMVFNGSDRVDPAFYSPAYLPVNGGLGSTFATQGDYYKNLLPFIHGWGITLSGVKNLIDLSFAISANTVNQWLLANHQTGMFDEFDLTLTGADFATADFDVDPTDQLSFTFNTNEAPSVEFKSANPAVSQVCVLGNCITNQAEPGSVKLVVNNLDINLDNLTDAVPLVAANIDIEFVLQLSVSSGAPQITLKDDSTIVRVNSFTQPVDPLITNALIASAIADGLESFLVSPSFATLIGQQSVPLALSTFPGLGGSDSATPGADCDGPSVDGNFCVTGQLVPYAALFSGGIIPRDIALLFRWLTVEEDGSYLSVGLDVRNKTAGSWSAGELAENYITWQLTP